MHLVLQIDLPVNEGKRSVEIRQFEFAPHWLGHKNKNMVQAYLWSLTTEKSVNKRRNCVFQPHKPTTSSFCLYLDVIGPRPTCGAFANQSPNRRSWTQTRSGPDCNTPFLCLSAYPFPYILYILRIEHRGVTKLGSLNGEHGNKIGGCVVGGRGVFSFGVRLFMSARWATVLPNVACITGPHGIFYGEKLNYYLL